MPLLTRVSPHQPVCTYGKRRLGGIPHADNVSEVCLKSIVVADTMQTPGSVEWSFDQKLSLTAWSDQAILDLSHQGHRAVSVSDRTELKDADGIAAAALSEHILLVGGKDPVDHSPAQCIIIDKHTGEVTTAQLSPSSEAMQGHSLTALADGSSALLVGGKEHPAGISLIRVRPDTTINPAHTSLPGLEGHAAVLLSTDPSGSSQILVTGGRLIATGAFNRSDYLLLVNGLGPINVTRLRQVRSNSWTADVH